MARLSRAAILAQLKLASRKGDRVALTLAIDQMKLWALSPRYWEKYLDLLSHPLARLVDMTVIKQGDTIARQKGWVKPRREPKAAAKAKAPEPPPRTTRAKARRAGAAAQPSLFDLS